MKSDRENLCILDKKLCSQNCIHSPSVDLLFSLDFVSLWNLSICVWVQSDGWIVNESVLATVLATSDHL